MSVYCQAAGGCSRHATHKLVVEYGWTVCERYPDGVRTEQWLVCEDHAATEGFDPRMTNRTVTK